MTGFGRKGLAAGQAPAPQTGFDRANLTAPSSLSQSQSAKSRGPVYTTAEEARAAQKQAFLAEERRMRGSGSGVVDDYGAAYYNRQSTVVRPVGSPKSLGVAYILWFFLCGFSAHRFYLGAFRTAVAQFGLNVVGLAMVMSGAGGNVGNVGLGVILWGLYAIWGLADAIMMPWIRDKYAR